MIRKDRELLADLARLNTDVALLAVRITLGSATAHEQKIFAERLIAAGERLRRRADESERVVIDEEAVFATARGLPTDTETSAVPHPRS